MVRLSETPCLYICTLVESAKYFLIRVENAVVLRLHIIGLMIKCQNSSLKCVEGCFLINKLFGICKRLLVK